MIELRISRFSKEINSLLQRWKIYEHFEIYDAFVFDVSKKEGKQTLIDLQNILNDKFPVKLKTGIHYGALS